MTQPRHDRTLFDALVQVDAARDASPLTPEERLGQLLDALGGPTSAPPASPSPPPPPAATAPRAANSGPAPSLLARVRQSMRDYEELLARYHTDFDALFDPARVDPEEAGLLPAEPGGDDVLLARLRRAQVLLLKYPIAAQAAVAALIAEGRRFAATPEGARMQAALADTELVRRGRAVWEATSLRALADDPPSALPSTFLDAFLQALRHPELEALLARLFTEKPEP